MWGERKKVKGVKSKEADCGARAQGGRHLIEGAGAEMLGRAGESFLKQVRRQEGRCGHARVEEGNGFLLGGLGKRGDQLRGGAEGKIKYKGLGEGGRE